MVDINSLEDIIVFIINLIGVWLIFQVYDSGKNEKLNQWFVLMTFFDVMWVDFSFLGNRVKDVLWAIDLSRINFGFMSLFLVSLYYFYVIYFLEEKNKNKVQERTVLAFGIFLTLVSFFTDLVVKSTIVRDTYAEVVLGSWGFLFDIYFLVVAVSAIFYSFRNYHILSQSKKSKIQYFILGISLFSLFNIVFNIIFPVLTGNMKYGLVGDYSAMILLIFSVYPMTKNNLTGVKTFFAQVIIALMAIVLAVDVVFLTDSIITQFLKIFILVAFLYCGRELIKSMIREEETMKEVRSANMNLAESNKDLNILLKFSDMVSQDLDSKKISQDIMDNVPRSLEYLGYNVGSIFLRDFEKDSIYVFAVTDSVIKRKMEKETRINIKEFHEPLSESNDPIAKSIKDKKVYESGQVGEFFGAFVDEEKSREVQSIIRAKSFISMPVFSKEQVIGAIVFLNEKPLSEISERSKEVLQVFASSIASVLENSQLYEKTRIQMKELSGLNKDLKRTNIRLSELVDVKNDFLHITSHQLRTPLTAIRGMIAMWLDGDFDKMPEVKRKEMLRRIYVSTDRLNNITNDMLVALELEGGVMRFEPKRVSLSEVIKNAMDFLQSEYDQKGLYLRMEATKGVIPEIEAEPNYLEKMIKNLIDNGCKYTRKGGLEIKVEKTGRYVSVYFHDTGIGMEAGEAKKMFEKFTRGKHAMSENPSGSGLGLYIVKKILEVHNGKISVSSDGPGKGAIFKISLPIKQA